MKRCLIPLLLLTALTVLTPRGYSQGVGYSNVAFKYTSGGIWPASGATITVCPATSTGVPCAPVVAVYADKALTIPCVAQVGCLTTDNKGNFSFFIAPGDYIYTVSGTGITAYGPVSFSLGITASGTNTFTALQTFNAGLTSTGPNALSGGGSLNGVFSGTATLGTITFSTNPTVLGNQAGIQFNTLGGAVTVQPVSTGSNGTINLPNPSGGTETLSGIIASGTSTLTANAALGATTSQAAITTAATNTLTTDAIEWSYASAPGAGDSLCIVSAYVTSGNVNFVRSNPTAGAQNVSAIVINWRVIR
jgi:hypothetical protein